MSKHLLDLSDSSEDESKNLNVSNDYAVKYDNWRRKEELQKLKDKYGNNLDVITDSDQSQKSDDQDSGTDDESSDQSDQSNQLEEQVFDDQFFKVYSALKSKNPSIYDQNIRFFDENKNQTQVKTNEELNDESKDKKMTLKDYHKKLIKEKKGITEEDEQEINESKDKPKGYYEELYDIRNEFKAVLKSQDEDDSDDEELFKGKTHSNSNEKRVNFLDENNVEDNNNFAFLKNYWKNDNELDESEKYLRDYIVNKRYVSQKEEELFSKPVLDENQFQESNQNDMFESIDENESNRNDIKINKYHFEEPESASIKRYPRIVNSIRDTTVSDNRAIKRTEVKERKKREKDKELKRLRKLKKEELKEKLNKLREISGNEKIDMKDLDLNVLLDDENDFDSSKYDQKMELLFGDNYYGNESNDKKPKFDYISGVDDYNYDYNEDMDNNEETFDNNEETFDNNQNINGKRVKTAGKTSHKKAKKNKSLEDIGIYEDLIGGDIATRYRYRVVESNDFGLTEEEILFADDKELNKWCSIKKMSQYRNDDEEKYDVKSYANKAQDLELKKKVLKSYYERIQNQDNNNSNNSLNTNNNKKKRKKRRYKKPTFSISPINQTNQTHNHVNKDNDSAVDIKSNPNKKLRRNKKKQKPRPSVEPSVPGVSIERLKSYGLSNREIKKVKNQIK